MFAHQVIESRRLLRFELAGFLSDPEIEELGGESERLGKLMASRFGVWDRLTIARTGVVQDKQLIDRIAAYVMHSRYQPRRSAMVIERPLLRLQLKRVFSTYPLELFETELAALGWLETESKNDTHP